MVELHLLNAAFEEKRFSLGGGRGRFVPACYEIFHSIPDLDSHSLQKVGGFCFCFMLFSFVVVILFCP